MAPGAMPSALSLEEAQDRLLALAAEQRTIEHLEVDEALGRYLASTLTARRTQPAADLSAMDGYAVRTHDLPGPWQVVGESACGHPFAGTLRAAQAVRIATGALVPDGASTFIRWWVSAISMSQSSPSRLAASSTRCASSVTPSEVLPVCSTAMLSAA